MKSPVLFLAALAGLASADCSHNDCLRAVMGDSYPGWNGTADCASLLAVTVTPATSTATSTVTVLPTVYITVVGMELATTSWTTTISTETAEFTVLQTLTASTESDLTTVTVTDTPTQSQSQTVVPRARRRAACMPKYPAYASACAGWSKYVSACSCVGVVPTTITAPTPVTTTVVTETTTVTSSVQSTVSTTETDVFSATAIASATETQTVSVTDTTLVTVTQTATPSASVSVCSAVTGSFRAYATQYSGEDEYLYADILTGVSGPLIWDQLSSSTDPVIANRYIWAIDDDGHLGLANAIPPYTYLYSVYVEDTATDGSLFPQLATTTMIAEEIAASQSIAYVNACVDQGTGELQLDGAGRTQILLCEDEVWLSNTLGSDVNRGTCVQMFPTVVML